jgi:hypothetical protein
MPKLFGTEASYTFATVNGGLFFVFEVGGRTRTCHESNSFLTWE